MRGARSSSVGSSAMHDTDRIEAAMRYHGRTKHQFSFRYSSTIVSSHGGRTQVKAKRVSLEDGKLSTESFEGELDGRAHDDAVRRAQQQVLEDAAPLLRMLRWMLPSR